MAPEREREDLLKKYEEQSKKEENGKHEDISDC